MLVTSTPSIEGKQIDSYLGIVMGSTVRARHIGTDILATLKNIVGGELKSYSILLNQINIQSPWFLCGTKYLSERLGLSTRNRNF